MSFDDRPVSVSENSSPEEIRLFRNAAVQAKSENRLGGITIAQPAAAWVITAFGILILLVGLAVLFFGSYTRQTKVTGRLIPQTGLSTLSAPISGSISRSFVQEGDAVEMGQPLMLVSNDRNISDGRAAASALNESSEHKKDGIESELQSQHQLLSSQRNSLQQQLDAARDELRQIQQEIETRQAQVRISREVFDKYKSLEDERYVAAIQVAQQQQAVLEQQATLQAMQRNASSVRRNVMQLEQAVSELPQKQQQVQSQAQQSLANIEQEQLQNQASADWMIKARMPGVVTNKLVEAGQSVQQGQPLLNVLPHGDRLRAQLLVPSRAIGFVKRGEKVLLRYRAFPYQKFGHQVGYVDVVSRNALDPAELRLLMGNAQSEESFYRVLVRLQDQRIRAYGRQHRLRPGMDIDAEIVGETRKLYEWLLEPLFGMRG